MVPCLFVYFYVFSFVFVCLLVCVFVCLLVVCNVSTVFVAVLPQVVCVAELDNLSGKRRAEFADVYHSINRFPVSDGVLTQGSTALPQFVSV
jgi:hypothetical protein